MIAHPRSTSSGPCGEAVERVGCWHRSHKSRKRNPEAREGATVLGKVCGLRALAFLPGPKAEEETTLMVQGLTWSLSFRA